MCHKCGYKNKSGSNFCNECGNNLQIQIADKQIANKQIADKFLEFQSPQYKFKINYPAKWQKRDKLPNGIPKVVFVSQSENLTDPFLEHLWC